MDCLCGDEVRNQEQDKVRRKLEALATWTPEEFDEELQTWKPVEIQSLWKLLEKPYRVMCRAFGMVAPNQRVSPRGVRTHKQINLLAVLQRYALVIK